MRDPCTLCGSTAHRTADCPLRTAICPSHLTRRLTFVVTTGFAQPLNPADDRRFTTFTTTERKLP